MIKLDNIPMPPIGMQGVTPYSRLPVLRYPPIGMCMESKAEYNPDDFIAKTTVRKTGERYNIERELSIWNIPEIDLILKHKGISIEVKACIDTGSYYSHVKKWIVEKLSVKDTFFASGNNPRYGIVTMPTFDIDFTIKDIDAELNSRFMLMLPNFDYDVIIGSHIFDVASMQIDGKNKRFIFCLDET